MRSDSPNPAITITETFLRASGGTPLSRTIVERKSVKKVKLRIKPMTTPRGRDFLVSLPPIVEVRIIGNIGRIQGESTVIIPAKNANVRSKIICLLVNLGYGSSFGGPYHRLLNLSK